MFVKTDLFLTIDKLYKYQALKILEGLVHLYVYNCIFALFSCDFLL